MKKKKNNSAETAVVVSDKSKAAAEEKMTIYDYQEKYVRHRNTKTIGALVKLFIAFIGLLIGWCLVSVTLQVWNFNEYAGYGAAGISVILFIVLYIVPIVKIMRTEYFETNVNSKTAGKAKKHNREVRKSVAEKIVDLNAKVDGVGWYDDKLVGDLEYALYKHDDEALKNTLAALYQGKIKKSAKEIIFKCSLKSGMYSAISQTSQVDAALVAVINLQMIKDIIYLYGFRPSDARLLKIFERVLRNSLISYGLGGLRIGNGIVKTMGDAAKGIPFLGQVISTMVDSSVQGLTNGTLTAIIGFQTIKYLNFEFKLQNILDGIEVVQTEEELQETCAEIERELKKAPRGGAASVPA